MEEFQINLTSMGKKLRFTYLLIGIFLLFITFKAIADNKTSSITLDNIEAISVDESISSICNTADGFCFDKWPPTAGIHFSED